jgi:asparagine N-glycosylation enzyme membrane subunit Stt3
MRKKSEVIKIAGYVILSVSCLLFILIPVVPFLGFSAARAAGISVVLLVAGEISFYLSLLILGKTFYEKIKSKLVFWKSKN